MAPPVFSTVGLEDYNINGAQGMLSVIHLRHFVEIFPKWETPTSQDLYWRENLVIPGLFQVGHVLDLGYRIVLTCYILKQ